MNLSREILQILCKGAVEAAKEAGKVIRSSQGTDFKIEMKKEGGGMASQIVTEVDRMSQKTILRCLEPLTKKYDLGLLAEEEHDDGSRFEKDYFWCIDPLDGTWPFSEGVSGYSVSIALIAKSGVSVIGVVYDPVEGNLYEAISGEGAKRNGIDWEINNRSTDLSFFVDRSFPDHPQFDVVCDCLNNIAKEIGLADLKVVVNGGSVLTAIYALENQPAIYFKLPKQTNGGGSIWDFAATACIYNELGGYVSDVYGNPLKLNRNDGTTFMNKEGVLFSFDAEWVNRIIQLSKNIK